MNHTTLPARQALPRKSTGKASRRKKTFWLLTMVMPGAIWLVLLRYLPMYGILIAFKNYRAYKPNTFWNNIIQSEWVGLKNFAFLKSPDTAVMMSELTSRFMAQTYQTLMFFPYFLSWVVASYFVLAFLDPTSGMIPAIQRSMGLKPTNFYHDTTYWPLILTLCSMWKNIGYSSVLYLAAITGIDSTLYEAAAVDGATKWQQVYHITLPGIRTMIIILLIMNVGKIFNSDFGLFYNVPQNSGSLYPVTQVIDTYVYRAYANTHNMGMSSAAGLLQNVVGFICIVITNAIVRKLDPESTLF